jgi:CMP-N-acetylneuraminic acid synthetase
MTTVSNVKVKYIRPKYKDLEQWLKDNNNVYIGRSGVIFINNKIFPDSASPFVIPSKKVKMDQETRLFKIRKIYPCKVII